MQTVTFHTQNKRICHEIQHGKNDNKIKDY